MHRSKMFAANLPASAQHLQGLLHRTPSRMMVPETASATIDLAQPWDRDREQNIPDVDLEAIVASMFEPHPAIVAMPGICPLQELPRELRDLIYEAYFDQVIHTTITIGKKAHGLPWIALMRTPPLLLVSHWLHNEAEPCHFARMHFDIQIGDCPVPSFDHPNLQSMRHAASVSLDIRHASTWMHPTGRKEQFAQLVANVEMTLEALHRHRVVKVRVLHVDLNYFKPVAVDVSELVETLSTLEVRPDIVLEVRIPPRQSLAEVVVFTGLARTLGGTLVEEAAQAPGPSKSAMLGGVLGHERTAASLALSSYHDAWKNNRGPQEDRISVHPGLTDRYAASVSARSSLMACDLLGYRTRNSSSC